MTTSTSEVDPAARSWVVPLPSRDEVGQPSARLACFPSAGAGTSMFRPWRGLLGSEVDLLLIDLPGREARASEAPCTSIDEMVPRIAAELGELVDVPLALFGHSMGAIVAFEVACDLAKHGQPPQLLVVGACDPPPCFDGSRRRRTWDHDELLAELRRRDGTPREVLDDPELVALIAPVVRADLIALDRYLWSDRRPLPCRIVAIGGERDEIPYEQLDRWAMHGSSFALQLVPGAHFFHQTDRDATLDVLRCELEAMVESRRRVRR